jgi:hemolysin-activating ACP:hemolysin acyltransferase
MFKSSAGFIGRPDKDGQALDMKPEGMTLQIRTLEQPWTAFALAAHFLAGREPFGSFPARELLRTIKAQVDRRHYLLAFEAEGAAARVDGYLGWALLAADVAHRFAAGGERPTEAELQAGGEIVWVLTAAAQSRRTLNALLQAGRTLYPDRRVMAVRHKDGRRLMLDRPPPGTRGPGV